MSPLHIRHLGLVDYQETFDAMRRFTAERDAASADEIWLLQHPPVFTQGMNGKPEHLHDPGNIPVRQTDRGGQITYHGPGQLIAYLLLDLRRRGLGVRQLVTLMEQAIIDLLRGYGIEGSRVAGAPGVYVSDAKIAALGLRARRNGCYHGLSLNVDMDMEPFSRINPCGYSEQAVTSMAALGLDVTMEEVSERLTSLLCRSLEDG